jgi:hypothetical protein
MKSKNKIDGVNLVPFLTGESHETPHDYLFWRKFDANDYACRDLDGEKIAFRKGNIMLFDLKNDISEKNNLIDIKPQSFDFLKNIYINWESEMLDPIFLGLGEDSEYSKLHPDRFIRKNNPNKN